MLKVEEVRPPQFKDSKSEIAVVKVTLTTEATTPTTTEATTPECDDKNKKLYFIIMIVLASVLGGLLILLVLGFICFKCCCRFIFRVHLRNCLTFWKNTFCGVCANISQNICKDQKV